MCEARLICGRRVGIGIDVCWFDRIINLSGRKRSDWLPLILFSKQMVWTAIKRTRQKVIRNRGRNKNISANKRKKIVCFVHLKFIVRQNNLCCCYKHVIENSLMHEPIRPHSRQKWFEEIMFGGIASIRNIECQYK